MKFLLNWDNVLLLLNIGTRSFDLGTSFSLVTFERQGSQRSSIVKIGKVVTETELVEGAVRLETSMQNNNMPEFCESKVATVGNKNDQEMWQFIGANFDDNPREKFLKLLGQDPKAVEEEVRLNFPFVRSYLFCSFSLEVQSNG